MSYMSPLTSVKSLIFTYLYLGLAFLLWENLVSSILGIYHFELRRTIWGIVYYCLLFLVFGGIAELLNSLYSRFAKSWSWYGSRYIFLIALLLMILWGFIVFNFINLVGIYPFRWQITVKFLWFFLILLSAFAGNLMLARRANTGRLPDRRRMTLYFCAAVFYLIISSKVYVEYFTWNFINPANLLLQPIFAAGALLLAWFLIWCLNSNKVHRWAILAIPVFLTMVVVGFSAAKIKAYSPSFLPFQPAFERPNIVVMLFDALRRDHVGIHDGKPSLTPEIDSLASQGKFYRDCIATASWTFPSIVSIMTSRLQNKLGVADLGVLPDDVPTLAEYLQKNGYRTGAISANIFFGHQYGFNKGFDVFKEPPKRGHQQLLLPFDSFFPNTEFTNELAYQFNFISSDYFLPDWGVVNAHAADFLYAERERPFFLYLHYMDTHAPYKSQPFTSNILSMDHLKFSFTRTITRFKPINWLLAHGRWSEQYKEQFAELMYERYQDGVRTADQAVADLMRTLENLGLSKNTIVVITSDHGEEFLEHGNIDHGINLFSETTAVPLIFYIPPELNIDLADQHVEVSLLDIAPTLLDIAGVQAGLPDQEGESLLRLKTGSSRSRYMVMKSIERPLESKWSGIIQGEYKLMLIDYLKGSERDTLLFNLASNPAEKINLYPEQKQIADSLAAFLQEQLDQTVEPQSQSTHLSPQEIESLRALGYVN